MWDAARNSIADPDGAIQGYFIYYRKDGSNDTFAKFDVQGQNRTSSDVEELQEYSRYEFQVVAYNYYGEGNASDVFRCFTEEAGRWNFLAKCHNFVYNLSSDRNSKRVETRNAR